MGIRFLNFDDGYSSATSPSSGIGPINSTQYLEATAQTTDATTTTLLDFQTASGKAYYIVSKGGGLKNDSTEASVYDFRGLFKNNGGTLTQSINELEFNSEDNTATGFSVTTSGTHIRFQINGIASVTYDWLFNIEILVFP